MREFIFIRKRFCLRGLEQYQNVIANNIAASHVAGFKKVAVSFEAVEGGEIARSTHDRLRNEMPGSFPIMKNQVDYNEGRNERNK